MLRTMSPTWMPAFCAGESVATERTRTSPVEAVVPVANAIVSTTSASTIFIVTPAPRTIAYAHHGRDLDESTAPAPASLIAKPSCLRIRTNTPTDLALMLERITTHQKVPGRRP